MSKKPTEAQRQGEQFYAGMMERLEQTRQLINRRKAVMVEVAVLVGQKQREGKLTRADVAAFDALFLRYGADGDAHLEARLADAIERARNTRITVTEN